MTTKMTLLGYDAAGDKAWQRDDGRVINGTDEESARWLLNRRYIIGWTLDEYVSLFGPITKDKP